jgi:hypothetical protein
MALAGAPRAVAQPPSNAPDTVCLGETKPYWAGGSAGSTYRWWIEGALQATTNDTITITWNMLGDYTIQVQETSQANCVGAKLNLQVHVKNDPPAFTPPELTNYCVEDITQAIYQPGGSYELGTDISPPRPDYYLLPEGSQLLDITNIIDDCPGSLTISWVIDFAGATPPDLTGTGQISAAIPPEGIRFPVGSNVITWILTDPGGAVAIHSVTLEVLPRPDIGDIPP